VFEREHLLEISRRVPKHATLSPMVSFCCWAFGKELLRVTKLQNLKGKYQEVFSNLKNASEFTYSKFR